MLTSAAASAQINATVEGRAVIDRLTILNDTTSINFRDLTNMKVIKSHGTIAEDGSFTNYNNIDVVRVLANGSYKLYFKDIYKNYYPTCTATPISHALVRVLSVDYNSVTFELSDATGVVSGLFMYQCN